MKAFIPALLFTSLLLSGTAWAQLNQRCVVDDRLLPAQAQGRNAWARKCGYITTTEEANYNALGLYVVFNYACISTCTNMAPVSECEPCISNLPMLGSCFISSAGGRQRDSMLAEFLAPHAPPSSAPSRAGPQPTAQRQPIAAPTRTGRGATALPWTRVG